MPPLAKREQLDELIATVLASSKYKDISPVLIKRIGEQELQRRRTLKEAVKETKNKLHQVGGAYLDANEQSQSWLYELQQGTHKNKQALQDTCRKVMAYHASTRERLPILDVFYDTLFAQLPPIHSILDIACGLNPLALPWMPQEITTYYAYDIYQHITDTLNEWLQLLQLQGHARVCDVLQDCPTREVDLAFILKTLPCLEQVDKQAGHRLLHTLNARHIIVSYPLQSLAGRGKGMLTFYEKHFKELIADEPWSVQRFEFANELVFVLEKNP